MLKNVLSIAAMIIGLMVAPNMFAQSDASDVDITITNETSRQDLLDIRLDLAEKGIDFQYHPQFNEQRKLVGIDCQIKTADGTTYEYKTPLADDNAKVKIVRTSNSLCLGNCEEEK